MRIAYFGPAPSHAAGVSYAATVLLRALVEQGAEVDLYATSCPPSLSALNGLRACVEPRGRPGRASGGPLVRYASGQAQRALVHGRLARRLVDEHRARPYDVVYQFSQPELLALRRYRSELPPIVVHPEVHAAGELAWHWRERALVRQHDSRSRRLAVRAMLAGRSAIQRRDLRLADAIVCPSKLFATQLAQDYGLQAERIHVIPNAVDLERFIPSPAGSRHPPEIVFASRLAVRKGVEMVVDLSHRLENGTGSAGIVVAGDGTMWSDYRWLLGGLNPSTAKYVGYVEPEAAAGFLGGAALLVQPSHYEPFSLSVAEALASGTPVVVSDRVGAGEWLKSECAVVFPAGDADAFEAAVRTMCLRMDRSEQEIRAGARQLAEQHFAPSIVARELLDVFESVRRARPWSQ